MKKITSKLALGPMSSEAIEATYKYSEENNVQLMLISSKSQIDWNGGYVNNWNTQQYSEYLDQMDKKYPMSDVLICRDHCGTGFNNNVRFDNLKKDLVDVIKTVEYDLAYGFDLIHVDMCHLKTNHSGKLKWTVKILDLIKKIKPTTLLELGTDENLGNAAVDLIQLERDIKFFSEWKPVFYVAQTGSLIKEINQVGTFEPTVVGKTADLLHRNEFKLKEHNADYLSVNDLNLRKGIVDAVNIAPMLGVLQTNFILHKSMQYGFDTTAFLDRSYASGRWKKWLYKNEMSNKYLCALAAGHYNFTSDEYRRLFDKINEIEEGDLYNLIINEHYNVIDNYMMGLI